MFYSFFLRKGHLNKVTLAIGDGANDVNMLQEADIGIGIYGQEGLRAVQASDLAVGEFQCLWKLLLVHGRWCYIRIAEMILYFFYKNMVMTLPQFFYSFVCGFSGQTIFDDWYLTLYNMIFTCFPLLIRGIFDQDVYYKASSTKKEMNPQIFPKNHSGFSMQNNNSERAFIRKFYHKLYNIGQLNKIFNLKVFSYWIFSAFFHSLIIFFACFCAFQYNLLSSQGYNSDLWSFSITAFTLIIITVTIRLGLFTKNWTLLFIFSMSFLSFFLYLSYVFLSNSLKVFLVYQSVMQTFRSFAFYACIFLVSGFFFAVDLISIVMNQEFSNSLANYFRILIKTHQENNQEYYTELQQEGLQHTKSLNKKSLMKMPRPSIFFEALEIKKNQDDFLKKKQFHFINIVNEKSVFASSHQYSQELPLPEQELNRKERESDSENEDEMVVSEDVCIQRNSSL